MKIRVIQPTLSNLTEVMPNLRPIKQPRPTCK